MAIALKSSKKLRSAFSKAALVSVISLWIGSGQVAAQPPATTRGDNFIYVVQPGDNLLSIRAKFATDTIDWMQVARLNKISNEKRLPVGKELLIPITWLASQPSIATVKSVSGKANVDGRPVLIGMQIGENTRVSTEENSSVLIELSDGSALRVGSASTIVVDRLKQYHSSQIVEARIRLEKGRVEAAVTEKRKKPFDVLTPGATAAVRGTNFGVSLDDPLSGNVMTPASVDVNNGSVAWSGTKTDAKETLPGGYGASVNATGTVSKPEALLPPVQVSDFPKEVTKVISTLLFPELSGAASYRVQVASDSAFDKVISENIVAKPRMFLVTENDGEHFIRIKAITADRIEGFTATTSVNVKARPLAPDGLTPATGSAVYRPEISLSWLDIAGNSYRVQAAKDETFSNPILDSVTKERTADIAITPVTPGKIFWRVASIVNNKQGPFTDAKNIELKAAPSTAVPTLKDDVVELNSDILLSENGNQLEVFLAKDADFKTGLEVKKLNASPAKLTLPAGKYFLKTRYLIEGFKPDAVPFGPTQSITIVEPVRDAYGNTIRSIDGSSIILGR
jgi:hypothetical protein